MTSSESLKSFDFVAYGQPANMLIDVKGRKVGRVFGNHAAAEARRVAARLESWVTLGDVEAMQTWERVFGDGFRAAFVFVYWCDTQPPDALFQEIFEHAGRWYALRSVTVGDYAREMVTRSQRWGTVNVPQPVFERISRPFSPRPTGPVWGVPSLEDGGRAEVSRLSPRLRALASA